MDNTPPNKGRKAATMSWIALVAGIFPLIVIPLVVLGIMLSFDSSIHGSSAGTTSPALIGFFVIAAMVCAIAAVVFGIIGLSIRGEFDRGWTRLRSGFGIGLGAISLLLPCIGGVLGFATVSSISSPTPPTIHAVPSSPTTLSPPPVIAPPPVPVPPPAPPGIDPPPSPTPEEPDSAEEPDA